MHRAGPALPAWWRRRKSFFSPLFLFSAHGDVGRCDYFYLGRRSDAFHDDAAERLRMLRSAMRHQRLLVLPLLDEHHLGVIGDALMQVIGDIALLLARLLDAGGGSGDEFGAC